MGRQRVTLARRLRALRACAGVVLAASGCAGRHPLVNPILASGRDFTADPAPLVVGDTLFVIAGRDMARPDETEFSMPEWQLLSVRGNPMTARWSREPHLLRPEQVFRWAAPGRAFAAQVVRGPDGRYYLYAPVMQAKSTTRDAFAIGVAVSDAPTGPWIDAHPAGPVVSQSVPVPNTIQNIDPTVLVDDDRRVYLYWGTFGKLKAVELERDMVTIRGTPIDVVGATGFFEAPWLFKRRGTYYLAYAANTAGPQSWCTEAIYYACIAYATAPSPLGPWTHQGVVLDPVSSTTSHPGIVEFRGSWYLVYHTADAAGGGHFRRSVAIDRLEWDDATTPARIRTVVPTGGATFDATPVRNIASHATLTASNAPVPVQYWLRALHDGIVRAAPLPPDMWGTWSRANPPQQWVQYQWSVPETISASSLWFWADHDAGAGEGVAPPKAWHLEYWTGGVWQAVQATTPYPTVLNGFGRVEFVPVTTRCLRAVFDASTDGRGFAAVAAQEWQVEAVAPRVPARRRGAGAAPSPPAYCG